MHNNEPKVTLKCQTKLIKLQTVFILMFQELYLKR